MTDPKEQKRSHFRILYPMSDRPKISILKQEFPVIDLSESGVRFAVKSQADWVEVTKSLKATIELRDGESVEIIGKVLRYSADQVVLILTKGISLQTIMKEQRFLIQKHKDLKF